MNTSKREVRTGISLFVLLIRILIMAYFAIGLGTDRRKWRNKREFGSYIPH